MIGKIFKNFEITKLLGKGGTGNVYLARQQPLGRLVALKVTPTSHPTFQKNIKDPLEEAKMLAALQHPNIVSIYDVGQEEDSYYIAIEYIQRGSLKQEVERAIPSEIKAWTIALQICQALQAALCKGIIHNDIKPENILMVRQDSVKLTDFGISEYLENEQQKQNSHLILGTPGYIAPEKYNSNGDFRSDIYSLGCCMYYVLTGQNVFKGESAEDIQKKHEQNLIQPPPLHNSSIGFTSSIILGKMLQKKPQDRYQSYGDLMVDIKSLLEMKSAKFATIQQARKIYTDADRHISNKKMKISQKLKVFTENMLHTLDIGEDLDVLIVGKWSVENIRKTFYHFSRVHFMESLAEVTLYLQKRRAIVILDSNYLESRTVEFCSSLYNKSGETFLLLLCQNIPEKLRQNSQIITHENLQVNLNTLFSSNNIPCAKQVNMTLLFALAQNMYWSFIVTVYNNKEIYAKVHLENGRVSHIEHEQQEPVSIESLTSSENRWEVKQLYV